MADPITQPSGANPYLQTLVDEEERRQAAAAPVQGNPYLQMLEGAEDARRRQMAATVSQAVKVKPDTYAEQRRIAKQLEYPVAAVEAMPDITRQQVQAQAVQQAASGNAVLERRFTDEDFARLAHDDAFSLAQLGTWFKDAASYLVSAPDARNTLLGDVGAGVYRASRGAAGVFQAGAELVAPVLDPLESITAIGGNPLRRLAEGFARVGGGAEAQAKELSPPQPGVVAGGVSSGVQSLTQNLLMLPLAFMPGGQGAALAGMSASAGGQSYQQAREQGLGMSQALPYATSQAVIEFATEKLPLGKLLGDLKAGTPLLQTIARQAALEIPGEQIATVLQDLNDWAVLPENAGKPFSAYMAERPSAAAQTLIATVIGVGGNVAVGKALESTLGASQIDAIERQNAAQGGQLLADLMKFAAESKLRERAPDTFTGLVQEMAEGAEGAPAQVRFDARTLVETLAQAGIDEAGVARYMPSVLAQLQEAVATGGEVTVPIGELTSVAGTDLEKALLQHARIGDNELSELEAQEAEKTAAEDLKTRAQAVIEQATAEGETRASAEAVKARVLEQLNTANRFTSDVNEAYATLHAAFFSTMAQRAGVTPEALFDRYALSVRAEGTGGDVLNASARFSEDNRLSNLNPNGASWQRIRENNPALAKLGPDDEVTVYRATIGDTIRPDDFVAVSKKTLAAELKNVKARDKSAKIIEQRVKVRDLLMGNDATEFVYYPESAALEQGAGGEAERARARILRKQADRAKDSAKAEALRAQADELDATAAQKEAEFANAPEATGQAAERDTRHRAPGPHNGVSVADFAGLIEPDGLRSDAESIAALGAVRGNPDADVTVYRAAPEGSTLRPGDWVTPSRAYAEDHGEAIGATAIIAQTVKARDLYTDGNSVNEWGYYPEGGVLNQFAGPRAKTADTSALATAQRRIESGEDAEQVRKDTGWHRGADGKWRFEISDEDASLVTKRGGYLDVSPSTNSEGAWVEVQLGDLLAHPRLFDAYPALRGMSVTLKSYGKGGGGHYRPGFGIVLDNSITPRPVASPTEGPFGVSQEEADAINAEESSLGDWRISDAGSVLFTLLHEIQHGIQRIEGFASGGSAEAIDRQQLSREELQRRISSLSDAYMRAGDAGGIDPETGLSKKSLGQSIDALAEQLKNWKSGAEQYRRLAGEVEARNTEARAGMTDAERAATPPGQTADVRNADVIVVFNGEEMLSAPPPANAGPSLKQGPRGTFNPGTNVISLLQNADLSTFLHESAHFFLEVMADVAAQPNAPADVLRDMNVLLDWFGIKGDEAVGGTEAGGPAQTPQRTPLDTWRAMTLEQKRKYHERFAESWEQYLLEGKAPSAELQPLFQKFRAWMLRVYKSLKDFLAGRAATPGGQASAGSLEQPAFHGTPHRGITQFSTDKIGTGEGAQAYGWGLYFASKKEIAEHYRSALTFAHKAHGADLAAARNERYEAFKDAGLVDSTAQFPAVLKRYQKSGSKKPTEAQRQRIAAAMVAYDKAKADADANVGQVYGVEIPEDSEMLLWDKPLGEQPEVVRKALEKLAEQFGYEYGDNYDGGQMYRALTSDANAEGLADGGDPQKAASDLLATYGIKGIKYLDGTSRTAGEGSYNYVIFSGDDVQITEQFYQQPDAPRNPLGLSAEVRAVFDRMLATDEQIRAQQEASALVPLFKTAEEAGMTPEQFAAYQAADGRATDDATDKLQARSIRDMRWTTGARSKALKALQKDAAAKRKAVEAEVRAEVEALPVYQAERFLRTGRRLVDGQEIRVEKGFRLNSDALAEMYPEGMDARPATDQLKGMTAANGLHPDVVAEMFGYSSGDQLVRALIDAEPIASMVEGMTDQRMLERYGDLATEAGIRRAADEAVHNEARGRFLATELKALLDGAASPKLKGTVDKAVDRAQRQRTAAGNQAVRSTSAATLVRAAKQFASQLVAGRKVRDLKPGQHTRAETAAAKAAMRALAKGDTQATIVAKRDEVLQHYAARETMRAQGEVEKGVEYLKKFEKDSVRKKLPPEYLDQIDKLLERVDLRQQTNRALDKRAKLSAWIKSQEELGIEPDVPDYLLEDAQLTSYRDMTVEAFRGLLDTVRQIEHLGRLKDKLLTAKDQREFAAIRDDIVAGILANAGKRQANTRTPADTLGKALAGVRNFGAAHIKVATWARIMDGGKDGGPVWEYFVRNANERGDFETSRIAQATQELSKIMDPLLKAGKMGGSGTWFESVRRSLNREQVLAIALNTGNASNLQRLLGGEGWTLAQLQPVLATLTPADWRAVQAIWDYFETFRPEIGAKERRVFGKEPAWIEAGSPITEALGIRGGYYPVKYDPAASQRAEEHADAEGAKRQLQGAYGAATTRRSFTRGRVEEVVGRPLLYSLQGVYSGVTDVIHDLAWHEWLIDTNRLLRSQGIDSAMREKYGPEVVRQFKSWRDDIAEGLAGPQNALDMALGKLRQSVSVAGLGFNVVSAMMQPLGLTQSIVRVGAPWVARGVWRSIGAPKDTAREISEKSAFMRNRARTRFRELNELRNRVEGQTAVKRAINENAYRMMMAFQQTVDVPTWWGAYEKAISAGQDEARAVALADQAVIDSQGGGQTKDLASIERGGPALKLFTVFYSFMNTALNLGAAQAMTPRSKARLAADMLLLYTVPAVLGAALKDALTPGDAGDDDDEALARKLAADQLSYLLGLFVLGREFGQMATLVTGAGGAFDYRGPAGLRAITDAYSFTKQASQGEFDDSFRKATVNLAGDIFGLPSAQINRSITGGQALVEGKTQNPAAVLFGYQEPR